MKSILYHLINKIKLLQKLYIKLFNKVVSDEFYYPGIYFRNNQINVKNNFIQYGNFNEIFNMNIHCKGIDNQIILNNNLKINGSHNMKIQIFGNNNQILIKNDVILNDVSLFIRGDNNKIIISKNCSLTLTNFHIENNYNKVIIGKGTTMHGREYKHICFSLDEGTSIIIGEDCMISNNVVFRTTDSHSIIDKNGNRLNHAKNIVIGNHCWVCLNVLILKGVKVNSNNVIASGSLCTKDFNEQNTIIAGNPAQVIKREVNWDRKFQ